MADTDQLAELPPALDEAYARVLEGTGIERRHVGGNYRLLEKGDGPAVVLLHGTRDPSPLWIPLIAASHGVRVIAPDRPQAQSRDDAVAWVGRLLDELDLKSATIVGHSAGGLWALWFALAHPERVDHLAIIGTPALPGTVVPLPYRLVATPGLGALAVRQRATNSFVRRFAKMMGEGESIQQHPALIDLMVTVGNDRPSVDAGRAEARQLIAPWALIGQRPAFRAVIDETDLRAIRVPATVMWGTQDPVGSVETAESITSMIPNATLRVFDAGHVPWFGNSDAIADLLVEFTSTTSDPST